MREFAATVEDTPGPAVAETQAAPGGATVRPSRRVRSLDGLRGIAALIVVFHHALLTSPALARAYGGPSAGHLRGIAWALTYTPLHLSWAGTEAVYVFFVLSGFVLTLATESASFRWPRYYPQRLLRLYVPVAAAVAFAALSVVAVPRNPVRGATWWLNYHADTLSLSSVFYDLTLIRFTTFLNSPLWSLKWEVYFSALLPVFILLAHRIRWQAWLLTVPLTALVVVGSITNHGSVLYLPMFGFGVLMAAHRHRLTELGARLTNGAGALAFLVAALLLTARWSLHPVLTDRVDEALVGVEVLGAALIVFLVWSWAPARRAGEARPMLWLGTRSFSLYLVHEPIVVSVAFLLGGGASALLTLAIAVPVSLLAAHLFFVFLEGPAHRLAQAVGRMSLPSRTPAHAD